LRTQGDPRPFAGLVQRELRSIEPTAAVEHVKTLEEIRTDSVAARTFAMRLLVGFSLVACLLATVGIYGVLSLAVGSRQAEIAIRMAVGAQRSDVLRLMLGDGLRLALLGIGLGVVVAIALSAGLKTFLFGVAPGDPWTLCGMAVVVMAITFITSWIPAKRATRVDPLVALRAE
jgi:putative ABC transport system permease protein